MRYLIGNKSFCHHVNIKVTFNFFSLWKVSLFDLCCVHIYPPPYQDEVLVMLDKDQDHFGISSYEENKVNLNLVITMRVGFQVQV